MEQHLIEKRARVAATREAVDAKSAPSNIGDTTALDNVINSPGSPPANVEMAKALKGATENQLMKAKKALQSLRKFTGAKAGPQLGIAAKTYAQRRSGDTDIG